MSEGFALLEGMRATVRERNACALDGVSIKYDNFLPYMWHAVDMGYVDVSTLI